MQIFCKYITDSSLNNGMRWYFFCHANFMLFVLKPKTIFVNQNKGKITIIILPWGRVSLAKSWRSDSFQLEAAAIKK